MDARRRDDRHFVAAELARGDAEDRAEHDAGVLLDGHRRHAGTHHLLGPVQELGHVHAHDGGRNQAEVGEHRVAAADVRPAEKDLPKTVALGDLLHLRARIGDGDEPAARFLRADELLDAVEEVLLEDVRLERRA